MMVCDDRGQVSLEYIMILAISLILLVVFTVPLTQQGVENTLDVSDSLDFQSDLSEIAQCVEKVYGEGQGSRHTVNIVSSKDVKLTAANSYISGDLKLKGGSSKEIRINYESTLKKSNIYLNEGENTIVVEWPAGSENMNIYTKLF